MHSDTLRQAARRARARSRSQTRSPASALRAACAVALLWVLAGACAHEQRVETAPARRPAEATLKVVNQTGTEVRVEAGGQPLGQVPAGSEQYFVGLSPGTLDLSGVSLDGTLSFRRDLLTLEPGETFTWILREREAAAARPGAGPGATASIVVENGTDSEVDVLLDGQVLGTAPSGRSARFDGIAAGSHRLEARAPETSFPREFPVLEPGETFTWRLRGSGPVSAEGILPAPGTGRLRVENPNPEAITVEVNGVVLGDVGARNARLFDNLAADRIRLSAESADGLTHYAGPEIAIEPGRVALWRAGAGVPAEPKEAVVIPPPPAAGRPGAEPLPPARTDVEGGAPAAPTAPAAEAQRPGEPAEGLPAPAGAPGTGVAVEAAGKTFVVENHTSQDLEVFFDGVSAGGVGAGMTRSFAELPGLRFTPSAVSANGARRYPHPVVDLSAQDSFTWIIEP